MNKSKITAAFNNFYKSLKTAIFITALLPLFLTVFACSNSKNTELSAFSSRNKRIVIWTSCSEFAQYIELFNQTSKDNRAILVYKENPALSLPPAKDELPPDIIVGSWLRSDRTTKNFRSLNYLFDTQKLSSSMFYKNLLNAGKSHFKQYLLPVSFNLPAVIFDKNNSNLIPDNYMLSLEQICTVGAGYNQTKKNGDFSRIGFAPLNDDSFLYLAAKLFDANFTESKSRIVWNEQNLTNGVSFLKNWIQKWNHSPQQEMDFAYKYLFMPYYRQVTSGRTLFACTQSDSLFKIMHDQELNVDYRWICQNGKIPMEDSFVMLGIYKKARNIVGASEFISWFFNPEIQRKILERKETFLLESEMFGIAGGFSSIRDVTEHILPVFYTQLLSNLPPAQMLSVPQKLPARWQSYCTMVVEPYIKNELTEENPAQKQTISDYEREWRKKLF